MKIFVSIMCLVLMFTAFSVSAQTDSSNVFLEKAKENYLHCLKYGNVSVRNSVIFQIMCLKQLHPDEDIKKLRLEMQKISKKDSDYLNRFHAKLACWYLDNRDSIVQVDPLLFEDSKEFFNRVYENKLLSDCVVRK